MNRTLIYKITENDIPNTIQSFLQERGYSSQVIKELKKMPESILIDGRWEYVRHRLADGETLTIRIQETEVSEKIPPVQMHLNIVYEDEDIMVINKPADMPIHPSLNNYYNSLGNGLAWYFEQQNKPFIFRCINRLDRDTSGLTIIAKHRLSAGILSTMVARRSACSPNALTRNQVVVCSWSRRHRPCAAIVKETTSVPDWRYRDSGSRPRLPTIVTLAKLIRDSFVVDYASSDSSDLSASASSAGASSFG